MQPLGGSFEFERISSAEFIARLRRTQDLTGCGNAVPKLRSCKPTSTLSMVCHAPRYTVFVRKTRPFMQGRRLRLKALAATVGKASASRLYPTLLKGKDSHQGPRSQLFNFTSLADILGASVRWAPSLLPAYMV